MHKCSLFFKSIDECDTAYYWLQSNFDGIEEFDRSFDGLALYFYTGLAFTAEQRRIIQSTLLPLSFQAEEN
jgi:hypothetical protein